MSTFITATARRIFSTGAAMSSSLKPRAVSEAAAANLSEERLAALGVTLIRAEGVFADRRTLMAGETAIRPRHFVIATGSVPLRPDHAGLDDPDILDVAGALDLSRKPSHLIVLGAGARALEFAQAVNRLGIDASVIDSGPALAGEDPELVAPLLDRLRLEGVRVREQATIVAFGRRKGGIRATLMEDGEEVGIDASHLVVVPGRVPAVDGLGLDAAGVDHGPAGIVVDRRLRTTNKRIYAIGDAVAGPASANRAEHHAGLVLAAITGRPAGWSEPAQTPDFDEITIMVRGKKQIDIDDEKIVIKAGESIFIRRGTRVRYANPFDEENEYIAICTPAFTLEAAHREV